MDNADVVCIARLASGCRGNCLLHVVKSVREDQLCAWSVSVGAGHCEVSCIDHTIGADGHNHGIYLVLLVMATVVGCEDTIGRYKCASAHSIGPMSEHDLQESVETVLQWEQGI